MRSLRESQVRPRLLIVYECGIDVVVMFSIILEEDLSRTGILSNEDFHVKG